MLSGTFLAILLIPLLYVLVVRFFERRRMRRLLPPHRRFPWRESDAPQTGPTRSRHAVPTALLLGGCTMIPAYDRPAPPVPDTWADGAEPKAEPSAPGPNRRRLQLPSRQRKFTGRTSSRTPASDRSSSWPSNTTGTSGSPPSTSTGPPLSTGSSVPRSTHDRDPGDGREIPDPREDGGQRRVEDGLGLLCRRRPRHLGAGPLRASQEHERQRLEQYLATEEARRARRSRLWPRWPEPTWASRPTARTSGSPR